MWLPSKRKKRYGGSSGGGIADGKPCNAIFWTWGVQHTMRSKLLSQIRRTSDDATKCDIFAEQNGCFVCRHGYRQSRVNCHKFMSPLLLVAIGLLIVSVVDIMWGCSKVNRLLSALRFIPVEVVRSRQRKEWHFIFTSSIQIYTSWKYHALGWARDENRTSSGQNTGNASRRTTEFESHQTLTHLSSMLPRIKLWPSCYFRSCISIFRLRIYC